MVIALFWQEIYIRRFIIVIYNHSTFLRLAAGLLKSYKIIAFDNVKQVGPPIFWSTC